MRVWRRRDPGVPEEPERLVSMKHGKKPTVAQRKLIGSKGLITENWLVTKDTPDTMVLVHRHSDSTTRIIHKERKNDAF